MKEKKKSVEGVQKELLRKLAFVARQERRQEADRREMPRVQSDRRIVRRHYTVSHAEIARQLEIDRTAVTRVLSGKGASSPRTRDRILAKAKELGMQTEKRDPRNRRIVVNIPVTFCVSFSESGKVFSQGTGIITNLSYGGCRIKPDEGAEIAMPVAPCIVDVFFHVTDGKEPTDGIFGIPIVKSDQSGMFGVQLTGYLGKGFQTLRAYLETHGVKPLPSLSSAFSKRTKKPVQKVSVPSVATPPKKRGRPRSGLSKNEIAWLSGTIAPRYVGITEAMRQLIIEAKRRYDKENPDLHPVPRGKLFAKKIPELLARIREGGVKK